MRLIKLLFFSLLLVSALRSAAQTTVTIGSGVDSIGYPYYTYYMDAKTDLLFTAAQLTAAGAVAGDITQIGFNVKTCSPKLMNGFSIKMKDTVASTINGFTLTGWTVVYSQNYTVPGTGWQMITLTTPFAWDGTSSILVEYCFDNNTFAANTMVYAATIFNMVWHWRKDCPTWTICDSIDGISIPHPSSQTRRPNTRFVFAHTVTLDCGNAYKGIINPTTSWQNTSYGSGTKPYWRYHGTGGSLYDFSLCSNPENSLLRVYDTLGNLLDSIDNNGPFCSGVPASMTWICPVNGYYYVSAAHSPCSILANSGSLAYRVRTRDCNSCVPTDANLGIIGTVVWGYSISGSCLVGGKWIASFQGISGRIYHFDLCPDPPGTGTANFDADIKILDNNCNIDSGVDGTCFSESWVPNNFTWTCLTSGNYYVCIAPNSSFNSYTCLGTGANTFTMRYYREPVILTCPTGAMIEGEPDCHDGYIDNFNGGCDNSPNLFTSITNPCRQAICGKSGVFNSNTNKDIDWYQLITTDNTNIYISGIAEFDLQISLFDGNSGCPGNLLASVTSVEGDSAYLTSLIGPGSWWIVVEPSNLNGWACGSKYILNFNTIKDATMPVVANYPSCGPTTLLPIPSTNLVEFFWQGTSCDTSKLYPATNPYPLNTSGTYYVHCYNSGTGCWSDYCTSADALINSVPALPVVSDTTICEGTSCILSASGSSGVYNWWDAPVGGNLLETYSSMTTQILYSTTDYYINAINQIFYGIGMKITETCIGTDDSIEIQNVGLFPIDVTGWVVAVSDDYSNIDIVNPVTWNLSGIINPGVVLWRCDAYASTKYWGSNIMWNPGNNSWAMIIDNLGNVQDFVVWGWSAPVIQSFSSTINGFPITLNGSWNGPGVTPIADDYIRRIKSDSQQASDWVNSDTGSIGVPNNMTYTVADSCISNRVQVTVNIKPLPDTAGIITGFDTTCANVFGLVYVVTGVPHANTYNWTYSGTGATIHGFSNAVTVDFASGATSGDLSVEGVNTCGAGVSSSIFIYVDPCTGIEENSIMQSLDIIPNPNLGVFDIQLNSDEKNTYRMKIINAFGQLIRDENWTVDQGLNRLYVDMTGQATGNYYLQLVSDKNISIKAFLISK